MTPLIEVEELKRLMDSGASYRLFDCRFDLTNPSAGFQSYQEGHIPTAAFADLDHDLAAPKNGRNGRHPLPSVSELEATCARLGISFDLPVIVYDNQGGMFAVRLWWMLRACGHTQVSLLNGGYAAWLQTQLPHATGVETYPNTSAPSLKIYSQLFTVDQIVDNLKDSRYKILDARSADRYRGENETLDPVGGHIPGALNRFFKDNLNEQGFFKSPIQLREEFLAILGNTPPEKIIHQCGSGVTACHNLFAMELAGLPCAGIYSGSWSEWCSDSNRPVATGLH